MMATQPPGRQHPLHLGQAGVAAVPGRGGQDRARHDQVRGAARDRQVVEEPCGHAGAVAVTGRGQLPPQDLAQPGRGLYRHDLAAPVDELQGQAARARADLDDRVRVARQPVDDPGMKPLRAGQPVVELRLEPVQQLPGQSHVGLRVTALAGR